MARTRINAKGQLDLSLTDATDGAFETFEDAAAAAMAAASCMGGGWKPHPWTRTRRSFRANQPVCMGCRVFRLMNHVHVKTLGQLKNIL